MRSGTRRPLPSSLAPSDGGGEKKDLDERHDLESGKVREDGLFDHKKKKRRHYAKAAQ